MTNDGVTIDAHYEMKTSFLGVIGMNTLPVNALAEVHLPAPTLVEMAMVLDFSGSMVTNDKYIRMRDAAIEFINKVKRDRADRTKIGVVPFSKYVYATLPGAMIRGTDAGQATTMMNACMMNRDYPYSATDQLRRPPSMRAAGRSSILPIRTVKLTRPNILSCMI